MASFLEDDTVTIDNFELHATPTTHHTEGHVTDDSNNGKNPYADVNYEQRFDNTLVKKQHSEESETIMRKNDKLEISDLGDLVLWNILSYATDGENFLSLLKISKQWKQYVLIITPLPILRIRFDSRRYRYDGVFPFNAGTIRSLCDWCYTKDSLLYRGGKTRTILANNNVAPCELKRHESWPSFQSQFFYEIYSYIYNVCTQRTPNNWSSPIYKQVLSWSKEISIDTVQNMEKSFLNGQSIQSNVASPILLIKKFNARLKYLINCFKTIDRVIGYLNRFYVSHHTVPTVLSGMMNNLAKALYGCKNTLRQLQTKISIAPDLLKDCTREEVSTFFTFSKLLSHLINPTIHVVGTNDARTIHTNRVEYKMAIKLLLKTSKTTRKKSSGRKIRFITQEGDSSEKTVD